MRGRYAKGTAVPIGRSKQEIESTLVRYGCQRFMVGSTQEAAMVGFEMNGRQIKMMLRMPSREPFKKDKRGYDRAENLVQADVDKLARQSWRALALVVKAKLTAVESGVATFDQEFLAYTVLPGGRTVAEELIPKLDSYYLEGKVPRLLSGPMLEGKRA